MAATLEVDRYGGTFARVRVTGHDATNGQAFTAPIVLASVAGPNGETLAGISDLEAMGGVIWYDAGGTLGKMTDGVDDVTVANAAGWIAGGYTITAHHDAGTGGHPNLIVTSADAPVVEPPVEEPPAVVPLPITGADIANAIGLPGTTPDLDALARTACEWLAPYLDPSKITPPDYPGPVREACLVIALDIFQNRTAAGGESVGYDVTAGPYRMGGALWGRVAGLIAPWAAQTSEVG